MKYACLVYIENKERTVPSEVELDAIVADCDAAAAWQAELKTSGHLVFSVGLQSVHTAVTVRNLGVSPTNTDGPFAETKEFLGGLTVIEARDLNEALQIVAKLRARLLSIEVRPVMEPGAELTDPGDRTIVEAIRRRHAS
ncbi:MAG TPA: YciI family protein [Pirellulaceae bacterium]|jgi:hypothetical protein